MAVHKKHDSAVAVTTRSESVLERVLDGNARAAVGDEARAAPQLVTGHLAGLDGDGRLLFLRDGSADRPIPVAIGTPESDELLIKSAHLNRRALVALVETGEPVLLGLLRERVEQPAPDPQPGELRVLADGETLNIRAERQIELRCGKASLLLRADGRVILSGTYVVSTSRGPNKIRGATVTLN